MVCQSVPEEDSEKRKKESIERRVEDDRINLTEVGHKYFTANNFLQTVTAFAGGGTQKSWQTATKLCTLFKVSEKNSL
ncbi:hypothetical protein [Geothermobacter hydrogeniphilus]|uniref:Uncharacterized protein n=1 Tax=Geothermobacter hydrogeniphilus TaxID=1969733 RepID=A0A1X0XX68_9BACT|nr:hypothetical protein [Geothermobacter hydrogeniphilus]ORJ57485.1 hypothetical protein B5V00_13630 [Geothermobacter hydrogeniphilus]